MKRNNALGEKVSTNILDTIDNANKKTLLDRWHKIDTLQDRSHSKVDWDALKSDHQKISLMTAHTKNKVI